MIYIGILFCVTIIVLLFCINLFETISQVADSGLINDTDQQRHNHCKIKKYLSDQKHLYVN